MYIPVIKNYFSNLSTPIPPPLPPPTIFDLEGERKFLRTSLIISSVQNKKVSETTKKEKKNSIIWFFPHDV